MSAAPLPDYRSRNRAAYSAARRRMDAGDISIAALETYNLVVKKCGPRAYTEITEPDLATERRLHKRTIQGHLAALRDAGMLRMERTGAIWRKVVTAFDDDPQDDPAPELQPENDPEVLLALAAQEPDIERGMMLAYQAAMLKAGRPLDSLFLPHQGDQKIASETIPGSPSSYKEDLTGDLSGATPTNPQAAATDMPVRPAGYFGREEPTVRHAETMQLLHEIGCWDATVRRYGHLPPVYVRAQIEAARRCGRAAELPAFVTHALATDGVYDRPRHGRQASSWGDVPKVKCSSCGGRLRQGEICRNCDPEDGPPPDDALAALWQRVVAAVDVPADDRRIWLEQTALLAIDGDVAVVGTANVFVRNEVRDRFAHLLVRPLAEELNRAIAMDVVIGGVP